MSEKVRSAALCQYLLSALCATNKAMNGKFMDAASLRSLRELRQRNRLTIRRARLRQVRVAGELLWSGELGSKFLSHQRSIFSRHLGSSAKKPLRSGASRRMASFQINGTCRRYFPSLWFFFLFLPRKAGAGPV